MAQSKTIKKSEVSKPGMAMVPPQSFLKDYISRDIAGQSEFDIFQTARDYAWNVLIEGPTGPGKTSAVMAFAAKEDRPFYAIPSNIGIEPSQLFGKYIPDGQGGFEWVDGPVTWLVRNGGVLLINEVNFMPERVATVLFGLLDKRRQIMLLDHKSEVIDAHEDLLIVADMNPDYSGTRPLNAAFRNRFSIQLWWDYDPAVEASLLTSKTLQDMAKLLRDDFAKGAYSTPISTNMLQEFEDVAVTIGLDFAIMNFVNHFPAEERGAVKVVVDTHKDSLDRDLFVQENMESEFPDDHPIWKDRREKEDGWEDPEWGIKGRDWVFDEDMN